ncbi:Splicing factor 45 [Choanephora cucurbitarum]|uniref:Splicing factor 45 n=1 Tax=Choanephora cucurbitarum TaxID=101091 RepID=A0A1C7NPY3_9FUNG|nr:Splicing factor 45 [Choanephora cucurbitarum]
MSFSLYGALPPSKTAKDSENNKANQPASKLSGLYSSLPAPETGSTHYQKNEATITEEKAFNSGSPVAVPPTQSNQDVTATATTATTAATTMTAGWSAINKFRPVLRRPTIQAKPKLNKPFIPTGATIVSTKTITKEEREIEKTPVEIENSQKTNSIQVDLGSIPLFTSADDVNGFRNTAQYNKKKKKRGKAADAAEQQAQPIIFDMMEDYDPHKPNDYEQYKEERKELREQKKRKREWERKQQEQHNQRQNCSWSRSRSRSYSPSPSRSRSRSRSYSRSRSRSRSPKPIHHSPLKVHIHHEAPSIRINVNETADDAYMRRAMLSQQQTDSLKSAQDIARQVADKLTAEQGKQDSPLLETPTHVVLLTNMVGPGEVDDLLQQETAEECSKYGKVERCLIFEVPKGQIPDDRAVRIFVKFAGIESAKQAVNDLNGRFFGGRVVSATFFDTIRFEKLDLGPTREEFNK